MKHRNITVSKVCQVCSATYHPILGRENTSKFCSLVCNGRVKRGIPRLERKLAFDSYFTERKDGCWIWNKFKNIRGYGIFTNCGNMLAHRAAWELYRGTIPSGMCVCHKCDNPSCVNPDHLFIGTNADNIRDMDIKQRRRNNPVRGELHKLAKLKPPDVLHIRASGLSASKLASQFNVSKTLIKNIKKRTTWKHL